MLFADILQLTLYTLNFHFFFHFKKCSKYNIKYSFPNTIVGYRFHKHGITNITHYEPLYTFKIPFKVKSPLTKTQKAVIQLLQFPVQR